MNFFDHRPLYRKLDLNSLKLFHLVTFMFCDA